MVPVYTVKHGNKELFGHPKIVPYNAKSSLLQTLNQSTIYLKGMPNDESRKNGNFFKTNSLLLMNISLIDLGTITLNNFYSNIFI